MPLDPTIPLQYRSPQITPYAEQAGQLLSLKSMLGQQQLQSQEIQQRQMDLEDQKTIRQAYMDAGGDMDKFQQLVTAKGVSPKNLMALNAQVLEMKQKRATLNEAQNKIQAAKGAALATSSQNLLNIADPQQRLQAAPAEIERLHQAGIIDDNMAAQLHAHIQQNGVTDDDLRMLYSQGMTDARLDPAQVQAMSRATMAKTGEQNASTLEAERVARLPGIRQKAEDEQRNSILSQLGGAQTREDYRAIWNRLTADPTVSKELLGQVPSPPEWQKETPGTLNRMAMNPEQRRLEDTASATAAATATQRATTNALAKQRLDLERLRLERQKTEDARSQSADRRQAYSEIQNLEKTEDGLNRQREQLGAAIAVSQQSQQAGGKKGPTPYYVSPTGVAKPITDAVHDEGMTADALVQDMKARYGATGPQLKRVIQNKYDQYGRIGVTPTIPLDQVHSAIDAGDEKVLGPRSVVTTGPTPEQAGKPAAPAFPAKVGLGRGASPPPAPAAAPPKTAPDAAPKTAPPAGGQVTLKLPDGKFYTFKDQATADAAMKKYGLVSR